ncbi:MAG: flagellar protein FlaG, partial [Syntrophomonas sp.]|uniref:flagellar protein FlaG n=1 Tax=Syntrophomonas sp. TaxID=2053627 RepID=UPI002635B32A
AVKFASCHLEFQPYEDSGRFQVKVVNSLSGEVIKEIPPDYLLDFSIKMKEMINQVVGLFVDELV